jgi:polyisoprenyl-phosphate glycosyltransferase
LGVREARDDPWPSQLSAKLFWRTYRLLVEPEIPKDGVDVFAVSSAARDALLMLEESHTSLVAQLLWIGYSRTEVSYRRLPRRHGKSAWGVRKKIGYLMDSVFSFTDIPIKLLTFIGLTGTLGFLCVGALLLALRMLGAITVPGYTAIMIAILFSASLITFGLGIVGMYVWRTYENTKRRPLGLIRSQKAFPGRLR